MTISSTVSRVSYSGNSATVAFSFPYYFLANADLIVNLLDASGNPTLQVLSTDYTVSGAGVAGGGTVTMVVAPPTGTTLVIYRDPAQTQDLHLVENDDLPVTELEKRLDKLTMFAQRLSNRLSRAMVLPDSFAATFDPTLPAVMSAGYIFGVKADGSGVQLYVMDIGHAIDIVNAAIAGLAALNVQAALIELAGVVTGTRAAPIAITAAGGITNANARKQIQFVKGNAAPITVTANPQISAGTTLGDKLILIGRDSTNTLTLANGTGLVLNGGIVLGASSILTMIWDGTNWVEESRNDI